MTLAFVDAELNLTIATESVEKCPVCQGNGEVYYASLKDRLYHAQGKWSFSCCIDCGILWMNPRPLASEINKLYQEYFTHNGVDDTINLIGRHRGGRVEILKRFFLPGRNADIVAMESMLLGDLPPGKLLDVGCGDGSFLAHMRNLGWDVLGVEPDNRAAQVAQEKFQIKVYPRTLDNIDLDPMSIDAISLIHVIEHVSNPVDLLRQCHTLLKPHGLLAIATPNIRSLGHKWFKQSWFHLDPPRHFILFDRQGVENLLTNNRFKIRKSSTYSRTASGIYGLSIDIKRTGSASKPTRVPWNKKIGRTLFVFLEHWSNLAIGDFGEEIGILAEKV